jgi:hypothetical protein
LHLDEPLNDRQAQAAAAGLARAGLVGAVEAFEYLRQLLGRDAWAGIGDLEDDDPFDTAVPERIEGQGRR